MEPSPQHVTQLLVAWSSGDQAARDELMPVVYEELRRLAHHYMKTGASRAHLANIGAGKRSIPPASGSNEHSVAEPRTLFRYCCSINATDPG